MMRRVLCDWLWIPLALVLGTGIGYLDLQVTNVQVPPMLLFTFSVSLALAYPRWWQFICGLLVCGVPLAHFIASKTDYAPPLSVSVVATGLALIPALLGSWLGGWIGTKIHLIQKRGK